MKYFKKFLVLGLFALFGVSCFCSSERMQKNIKGNIFNNTSDRLFDLGDGGCFWKHTLNSYSMFWSFVDGSSGSSNDATIIICGTGQVNIRMYNGSSYYAVATGMDFTKTLSQAQCDSQYDGYILPSSCPSQYTSLECQTAYSLIPVSEVTENYCTANYDLISPSDCPISSGPGTVSRSAIYLNNIQYAGANSIYININDILDWSTTYVDSGTSFVIDVDGYNADTEYLSDILTIQEFHPDSEDFTVSFVGGLTLILPYVVVALFVIFVRKLIRKIFKS